MGIMKFARGANYRGFYEKLRPIAAKKRVPAPFLFADAAFSTLFFGSGLQDYLNFEFFDRSLRERSTYATIRVQQKLYDKVNPEKLRHFFANKAEFYGVYRDYMKRLMFYPENATAAELADFLKKTDVFVEKPYAGTGGKRIAIRRPGEVGGAEEYLGRLKNEKLLLEEFIIQHPRLSEMCPKSVNTMRIMTSCADPASPEIIFASLRAGDGEHDVDNFHSGGMGMLVNSVTGKVEGDAFDKNNVRYGVHPVTGVKFDGFQIPFWDETVKLVLDASLVMPEMTVVGWDIAVTENGPVIVEGNSTPGFDMVQVACMCGRKDIARDVRDKYKKARRAGKQEEKTE